MEEGAQETLAEQARKRADEFVGAGGAGAEERGRSDSRRGDIRASRRLDAHTIQDPFRGPFSACRGRASGQQVGEKARRGGTHARPETLPANLLPDSTMKRPEPSSL